MGVLQLFKLDGKVAIVTGAARGLGQALAVGLAEAGAAVLAVDRNPCTETIAQIENFGGTCYDINIDLSGMNDRRAKEMIDYCIDKMGGLHILANNAGIIRRAPSLEFTPRDWEQVLDVNLNSVFYLSQAAGRHFSQQGGGKIINIASMLSFQGGFMVPSYTAAKSAILGLTRALSNEWAAKGINVNAIAPGYFITEVTAGIRTDAHRSRSVLDRIPAGRWGAADDLKGAVVFLASSASDYMHGAVVPVDGGWLAR